MLWKIVRWAELLWQLRERSFSQIRRELGVCHSPLRRLMEREIDEEALGGIVEDGIFLGIDEHSFRHQGMVHTVTEVKKRRILGILKDDRIATLKQFLGKIPKDKVREVCIDMKESLRKAVEKVRELYRQENREEATKILDDIIFNLKSGDAGELIR